MTLAAIASILILCALNGTAWTLKQPADAGPIFTTFRAIAGSITMLAGILTGIGLAP